MCCGSVQLIVIELAVQLEEVLEDRYADCKLLNSVEKKSYV